MLAGCEAMLLDETGTELPAETVVGGGIGVANRGVGKDDGDETAIDELLEVTIDTGGCCWCELALAEEAPEDAEEVGMDVPLAPAATAAADGEGGVGRECGCGGSGG